MIVFLRKILCCLIYLSAGVTNAVSSTLLPKGFVQCQLSSPNLNKCIKDGLQSVVPIVAKGIPNLGILPTEPLQITALTVNQGSGPVQINMKFKDLNILNLNSTIIEDVIYDPKNYTFNSIILSVEKPVILEGLYEINGKVLILPITGNGTCRFSLENYKSFSTVRMEPVVKKDITYLKIKGVSWKFITSKLHLRFNNLFNGDKVLGENMNVFLNENWKELLKEMQPVFEEALGIAFISMGQHFFDRVPLNQIFKD